jgi:adenylyltransferase/sulfurtransferase
MLTPSELIRYQKQLKLPEWSIAKQHILKSSHVLVVGAGGLGVGALPYLAAVGLGHITIVDHDVVDLSNLGRQVIYTSAEVGQSKALLAEKYIKSLNPEINVESFQVKLAQENAIEWIQKADLVIDCTDNFTSRYLINDICVSLDKPFVYAAIHAWEGLLSVCNALLADGTRTATYRCLFPESPNMSEIPTCDEVGVLGFIPGVMGLLQAKEAIFYLAGFTSPAQGSLLRWDARDMSMKHFKVEREPLAAMNIFPKKNLDEIRGLTVDAAFALLKQNEAYILDVREHEEFEIASIPDSIQIPMHQVAANIASLPIHKTCIVMCHHGMRSAHVIRFLQQEKGMTNLFNLTGGIDAWSLKIDANIPRY